MYMYTHIERWWLSVLLLLTGREKDQCRGGVLQEKLHKYNNIYSHSYPSALCICQIIKTCFVNLSLLFVIYAFFVGVSGQGKLKNTQLD